MTYGDFKNAIKKRRLTVAVVGLGYVGMPTSLAIARAGIKVVGIDINRERVKAINSGKSFIAEIPDEALRAVSKKYRQTSEKGFACGAREYHLPGHDRRASSADIGK